MTESVEAVVVGTRRRPRSRFASLGVEVREAQPRVMLWFLMLWRIEETSG